MKKILVIIALFMSTNNIYCMHTMHKHAADSRENSPTKKQKSSHDINQSDLHPKATVHYAAEQGHVNHIKLLYNAGADIDALSYEGTPVHCSLIHNQHNAVTYLLNCGADLTIKAPNGKSPLRLARDLLSDYYSKQRIIMAKAIQKKIQQHAKNSEEECPICLIDYSKISYKKIWILRKCCEQLLCKKCTLKLKRTNQPCPFCRAKQCWN